MKYINENGDLNIVKLVKHAVMVLIVLVLLASSFGTVKAGERGVKTRFGAVVGVIDEGLYFKLPYVERVAKMEIKTRTVNYDKNGAEGDSADTSQLSGASKDLQDVWIGVMVNYHISPEKVSDIFSQYRSVENYETNVIEPVIREVVKSTSAQYTAEELVTKRSEYSDKVNVILNERFMAKDSILERFSVTNFEFSNAFTQAIESKVTATQNAEAAKINLNRLSLKHNNKLKPQKLKLSLLELKHKP